MSVCVNIVITVNDEGRTKSGNFFAFDCQRWKLPLKCQVSHWLHETFCEIEKTKRTKKNGLGNKSLIYKENECMRFNN